MRFRLKYLLLFCSVLVLLASAFFIPALIWFGLITVVYALFDRCILLIFGGVQLAADIWFEIMYRKLLKNQK